MALTTEQTRQLQEINDEIALLDKRLARAHSLGDNSSAGGINMGYSDNPGWVKRRDQLRAQRNILEALQAGTPQSMANIGITSINYIRNSTPYA